MSFTRTESERLARLKGCTTGIYCRYGRPTGGGGVTGPTGPAAYSFFTLGGNQGALTAGTGSMIVVNMNGPTGTVSYSNILQAVGNTGPVGTPPSFLQVGSDIIPKTNNIYSIGTSDMRFKNAYFGSDGIYIGNTHIGATGDTLVLPSTVRLGSINGPLLGATGPTGPGGSGSGPDGGMQWINTNLLGPSPQIIIDDIVVRSSEIFIGWTYPIQQQLTFVDIWVPAINAFSAELTYGLAGAAGTQKQEILSNKTEQQYVDYKRTATLPPITGIVLTNVNTDIGYKQVGMWHTGTNRPLYRHYHPDFASLNPNVQPIIKLWYSNFSSMTTEGSAVLNVFISAGPPGPPRNLQGSASSSIQGTLTFKHPEWADICDNKSAVSIKSYTILYDTAGSSRRYPESYPQSQRTKTKAISTYNNGDNLSEIMGSTNDPLYPDSLYRFIVSATNSANRDGPGEIISFMTSPISSISRFTPQPILASPAYTGTIKRVLGDLNISGKLLNLSADGTIDINNLKLPIHYVDTRGSTASQLMRLTSSFKRENDAITYSANTIYGGYPAPTGPLSDVSADGVIIYTDKIDDFNKTEAAKQGFFLTTDNRISVIMNGRVIPSPDKYTLSIQHEYMDGSGTVIMNPPLLKHDIDMYYDTPPAGAPEFLDVSYNFNNTTLYSISGIKVLVSGSLNTIFKIDNMGSYFYKSPIVVYSSTPGIINYSKEDSTNITDITNNRFNDEIIIPQQIPLTISSTTFINTFSTNFTVYNLSGNNTYNINNVNAIIDMPSYNLIYNISQEYTSKYPRQDVILSPTANNTYSTAGRRLKNGTSRGLSGIQVNPYVCDFNVADDIYIHTESILNNEELQIYNGKYRSKGVTNTDGYINYKNYYDNYDLINVNYTDISSNGYRFATFKWTLDALPFGMDYTRLSFTLHDLDVPIDISGDGFGYIQGTKLLLFYRFVENNIKTPTTIDNYTTIWIDGNRNYISIGSENFVNPPDNSASKDGLISISSANTICTFYVKLPTPVSRKVDMYCRVGLPMNVSCSFSHIKANITVE